MSRLEGNQIEKGKHSSRVEVRVRSRGERDGHIGGEKPAHKLNETQQEEEGESGDDTEKEQTNRQLTNEKR